MNTISLKCRACGEEILIYTKQPIQDLTVLVVHSECALIYSKAA